MDYKVIDIIAGERMKNARTAHSMPVDVFDKACRLLNLDPYAIMQEAADAYAKTFEK